MEEYINKKEVLKQIREWWGTTVLYGNREPAVIAVINELPTIKVDDGYCPKCGINLEKSESEEQNES